MKKILLLIAVFALILGASSKSAQAFSLGGYEGPVKFKFSDWSDVVSTYGPTTGSTIDGNNDGVGDSGYGNADMSEDAWGIFDVTSIIKDNGSNDVLWQKPIAGSEVNGDEFITGIFYGLDDDLWQVSATGDQHTELTGGKMVMWLDVFGPGYTPLDATLGVLARTGPADYPNVTDGTPFLTLDFAAGIQYGDNDTTNDHITLDSDLDVDSVTSNLTGDGSFYLDVTGGTYASLFDTNGHVLTDDSKVIHTRDFRGGFRTRLAFLPGTTQSDGMGGIIEPFEVVSEDPIEGNVINPIPEPTTVALLGIGLVGMAGVAVRRKLSKKQ